MKSFNKHRIRDDIKLEVSVLGDPSKLRVVCFGDGTVDLLPYEYRKAHPQTRIRLNKKNTRDLIVKLIGSLGRIE